MVVDVAPSLFERACALFPHLLVKSGVMAVPAWGQPQLRAVAKERLLPMVATVPEFPLDKVTGVLAALYHDMMDEKAEGVATTQFLDLVEIFPKLYE